MSNHPLVAANTSNGNHGKRIQRQQESHKNSSIPVATSSKPDGPKDGKITENVDNLFTTPSTPITFSTTVSTQTTCKPRIVGYYDESDNREITENQLQKLTHVIFAFVDLSPNGTLSFRSSQSRKKLSRLIEKARLVNSALKVMFSIGGQSYDEHFSSVAAVPKLRRNLIESIIIFIRKHKIDGVDLYWKRPVEFIDRNNYVLLLRELREKLSESSEITPILSVVTPSFDWPIYPKTVDLEGILRSVDFINVNSQKYYGLWYTKWGMYTGPPSPLYSGIGLYENSNADWTMRYHICKIQRPKILNMALPFYGAYWKNVEGPINESDGMWFTAEPKTKGETDYEGDYIAWRDFKNQGWNVSLAAWHQESRTSFIWNPQKKEFLGIENQRSLKEKINYAMNKNLGGVTIWSVEMDDDYDTLLNTVSSMDFCSRKDSDNLVTVDCDDGI